jgi:2-polyprenyl-3-methyl-5-hydroxy-6-metoxy-1,4-benzoquinol methylase
MNIETQVQNFYSEIKFPGLYSFNDLNFYQEKIDNEFLSMYNIGIQGSKVILDIGCGTGFITNLLAIRNPNIKSKRSSL